MAEVIPSENVDELIGTSLVAFQTSDLKALAAKILRRANEVAQQKIASASAMVAEQETKGYQDGVSKGQSEGYQKGEAEGKTAGEKAAREEFNKTVATISLALKASLTELNKRKTQLQANAETDLLNLALAIAKRIVRSELSLNPQSIIPIVREAIGLCNNRSDLTLHLHPDDIAPINAEIPALHAAFTNLGRVALVADKKIERGTAMLSNRESTVDLRLAQQFSTLERALTGKCGNLLDDLLTAPHSTENASETVASEVDEKIEVNEIKVDEIEINNVENNETNEIPIDENSTEETPPQTVAISALSNVHNLNDLHGDAATEKAISAAIAKE